MVEKQITFYPAIKVLNAINLWVDLLIEEGKIKETKKDSITRNDIGRLNSTISKLVENINFGNEFKSR